MKNTNNKAKRRNNKIRKVVSPYRDQGYYNDVAAANAKKQSTFNNLQQQQQNANINYGFGTDPTTNPYSRAALLQSNYNKANRGTLNSMAAGGQLYSGAHANARNANRGNYEQGYDATRKAYNAELANIRRGREEAVAGNNLAVANAGQAAIARQPRTTIPAVKKPKNRKRRNNNKRNNNGYSGGVRP